MSSDTECLHFQDGGLLVRTPWDSMAGGAILVDDEPVRSGWSCDAQGHPTCRHGDWQLAVIEGPAAAFSLRIANTGSEPQRLRSVHFARWNPGDFSRPLKTSEFRELIHGGSFRNIGGGVKPVGRKTPWLDFVSPSSMFTVYQQEDGDAVLLGIVPPMGEAFCELVTLHSEPHCEGTFGFEVRHIFECVVDPGSSVHTSPIVALAGRCGTDLMSDYGKLWHELLDRKPSRKPMVGWNSWDYYSGAVTRQAMDENLAAAKELFGDALQVFAIDEGWERQWGDWNANAKFGAGLADFCRHVKLQGGIPGIWTAPLLVNTYNPLFFERPEWFAGGADGQVKIDTYSYGPMAYLDVTNPEVLDHVKGLFTRLRSDGFQYYKVDFCHCILEASQFSDPRVGRSDLIRRAFAAIREAIGEEAYLLSCGSPYESVVGLVDAVRTTGDIHIFWGHVLRNAGALCTRWWMHSQLWNCDPDFLVVRGSDTAEPPYGKRRVVTPVGPEGGWMAGVELNEMEARTYALLVHLTGGDVLLGDCLRKLNPSGLAMLNRVLRPRSNPAVPVDLFDSEQDLPRIWISRGESDSLVGLFNWSDKPARIHFEAGDYQLPDLPIDFWTDEPVEAVPTRMPRRSSVALRFLH